MENNIVPAWCVGNHLLDPSLRLDAAIVEAEGSAGVGKSGTHPPRIEANPPQYDMISSRITNSRFCKRIQDTLAQARSEQRVHVHIEPLTADEVNIQPGHYVPSVVALASPWIEVDATDRLLAHVSRQILDLELSYAAFCGISHVVLAGPRQRENIAEYAQAIATALAHATYMQLLIQLPIDDWVGDENSVTENLAYDAFSAWNSWNTIRTVCKYNAQLGIGKGELGKRIQFV